METASQVSRGRLWIGLGAASAFLAVALGAFGAHTLRPRIPTDRMDIFQTGANYHLIHSLAILILGVLTSQNSVFAGLNRITVLLLGGIMLFSGSLYLLAITGIRTFGAITPIGGICFLAAWALVAIGALKNPRE